MTAALYIHVPFCLKKCNYCDFYSEIIESTAIENFLNACADEFEHYANHPVIAQSEFQTCYFGGGTPSLLSASQIGNLINKAQRQFYFSNDLEFTIEANPETLCLSRLKEYKSAWINRLSLGIQSFSDVELKILGRIHNSKQAKKSIEWAFQAGFENINLDLMFAIPGQTMMEWIKNLEQAIRFRPQHLSIYCLTIEDGTQLERQILSGELKKITEETEREMYLWSINRMLEAGYQQYEISNFALPGFECKHNLNYWNGTPYLGIGPAAHSFWNYHRQWNVSNLKDYLNLLNNNRQPIAGQEQLSCDQKMLEYIYLSLRTSQGINIQKFEDQFNLSFTQKFNNVLKRLMQHPDRELFQIEENRFKLNSNGFVLFDEICQYFAAEI